MKVFLTTLSLLTATQALAGNFKVANPVESLQRVQVPIQNISCVRGPFGFAQLQVLLVRPLGNSDQKGILKSPLMGLRKEDCQEILTELGKTSTNNETELEVKILSQSVVRYTPPYAYTCEAAQQEVVSGSFGEVVIEESSIRSEEPVDCPSKGRDQVIYVLHEDGIPTR